jgi:putative flippase GtrA
VGVRPGHPQPFVASWSSTVVAVGDAKQLQRASVLARTRTLARHYRGPDSGVLGQGVRFVLSGGTVALVYLLTTTALAEVVGLPFQVALAIGFSLAVSVHFTLQRMFVWADQAGFALPLRQQVARYLVVALAQYAATAASTALLPAALGLSSELVYLATVAVVLCANFLVFRRGIFHVRSDAEDVVAVAGSAADFGAPPIGPPVRGRPAGAVKRPSKD